MRTTRTMAGEECWAALGRRVRLMLWDIYNKEDNDLVLDTKTNLVVRCIPGREGGGILTTITVTMATWLDAILAGGILTTRMTTTSFLMQQPT